MSYPTDTILTRREPKGDKFDKLKVVGPSPIKSTAAGEWGSGGDAIVVHPIGDAEDFGPPENLPIRAANEFYEVEYEPDPAPTHLESQPPPRVARQLSPEEQFRAEARGHKDPNKVKPQRAHLDDNDEN